MLHIEGPDDIIAAPSREEADAVAAAFNSYWAAYLAKQPAQPVSEGRSPDRWPTINPVVAEWDSTPKQHASNLKRYWPDYAQYLKFADA
jgi:hypothetical protein